MQEFNLTTGKTLSELISLTSDQIVGDFKYNAANHLLFENVWHKIEPNSVIGPVGDRKYHYKDKELKIDTKYCAQLYWKMCAQVWTNSLSSSEIIANSGAPYNSSQTDNSAIFNDKNAILQVLYASYNASSPQPLFAISNKLDNIIDTSSIVATLKQINGLNNAKPSTDYKYIYSTTTGNNPIFTLGSRAQYESIYVKAFGHPIGNPRPNKDNAYVKCTGGDNKAIEINYSQPENNTDNADFYYPSGASSTLPQALPLGIGLYSCVATTNNITTSTSSKIIPFMVFCLGVTPVPTEA